MTDPHTPDQSRERFERWWPDKQIGLERYSDGSYFREHVRFAYAAWQAALEAYSVRETVHYAPACEVTQIQRNSIPHALWQLGDARLVWVNEGDIIKAGILVEGEPCARAAKSEGK
jgi:hypothetical protein